MVVCSVVMNIINDRLRMGWLLLWIAQGQHSIFVSIVGLLFVAGADLQDFSRAYYMRAEHFSREVYDLFFLTFMRIFDETVFFTAILKLTSTIPYLINVLNRYHLTSNNEHVSAPRSFFASEDNYKELES